MFVQKAGDAGLVKIPRSSLTGRVWDDTGALTLNEDGTTAVDQFGNLVYNTATGYNGIQDEGERGLGNQVIYLTQWYWKAAMNEGANTSAVSGEGEWVQNTGFGADRYTSNKELLTSDDEFLYPNGTDELRTNAAGDGKQTLYFVTKGGELVAGYSATKVLLADGTLRDRVVSVPSQDDPDQMVEVDTIAEGLKPGVLALLTSAAEGTEGQWLALAALVAVCTGFGFTLQPVAQQRLTADRAALFCAITPLTAGTLGIALLGEPCGPATLAGMALIVGAIVLASLPERPGHSAASRARADAALHRTARSRTASATDGRPRPGLGRQLFHSGRRKFEMVAVHRPRKG